MIAGIFFEGSGLGDQLFRYITVRTLAEEKGYEWGMIGKKNFKGDFFADFDFGKQPPKLGVVYFDSMGVNPAYPNEPEIVMGNFLERDIRDEFRNDIRSYDPEINFVEDNTIIDGSFEDVRYWSHNMRNIAQWLAVEPLEVPDDTCIVGFRGGEYSAIPALFLPKSLYFKGVDFMKQRGVVNFEVHTDDPQLARQFFPDFKVIDNEPISHSKHTNMGLNWRAARYAKHAVIPNSAFYILPRLLKHFEDPTAVTIAPRYWAGHNERIWKRPACFYKEFLYITGDDTKPM